MTSAMKVKKRPPEKHQHKSAAPPWRENEVNVMESRATPMCTVRFGPTRVSCLVDTGADRSVIRYDMYRRIPQKMIMHTFKSNDPPCVTATGDPLEIVVEAEIRFMVGRAALQ